MAVHRERVEGSVEVRVVAMLSPNTIRVHVGVGVGHLDGGFHQTWPATDVPADLRYPNARFWFAPRG